MTGKVTSNGSRGGHGEMLGGQANLDCKPGKRDKVKSSGGSAPASTHLPCTAPLLLPAPRIRNTSHFCS